ncbi:hypothetical protein ACFPRL_28835 [Pseudoclavibacter helvolus]
MPADSAARSPSGRTSQPPSAARHRATGAASTLGESTCQARTTGSAISGFSLLTPSAERRAEEVASGKQEHAPRETCGFYALSMSATDRRRSSTEEPPCAHQLEATETSCDEHETNAAR